MLRRTFGHPAMARDAGVCSSARVDGTPTSGEGGVPVPAGQGRHAGGRSGTPSAYNTLRESRSGARSPTTSSAPNELASSTAVWTSGSATLIRVVPAKIKLFISHSIAVAVGSKHTAYGFS